jgi:hypothetical protein
MKKQTYRTLAVLLTVILAIILCSCSSSKFISSKDQTITKEAFDKLSSSDLKSSGVISSPDKKINAVVYPFEFEQSGEIYIFDLGAGKGKKLLSENDIDNKLSIKYINFYDDENLIVILGNKYWDNFHWR